MISRRLRASNNAGSRTGVSLMAEDNVEMTRVRFAR